MANEIKMIYLSDDIRIRRIILNFVEVKLDVNIPEGYVLLVTSETKAIDRYGVSIHPSPLILTRDEIRDGRVTLPLHWDGIYRQNYIDLHDRLKFEASEDNKIHIANGILIKLASE